MRAVRAILSGWRRQDNRGAVVGYEEIWPAAATEFQGENRYSSLNVSCIMEPLQSTRYLENGTQIRGLERVSHDCNGRSVGQSKW